MKKTSDFPIIAIIVCLSIALFTGCAKIPVVTPDERGAGAAATEEPDSSGMGLVVWYPFNDTGGEYSGNGNPGASVYDISSANGRNGDADGAYAFNGVSSYLRANNNSSMCLSNTDFTINVWVKPSSYGGANGSVIIGKRGVGPANGWVLSINNKSNSAALKPGLVSFIPGSTDNYAIDTTALPLNRWSMITVMYNNAAQRCSIYLDGVLNSVTEHITAPAANTTADIYIGRDNVANTSESYFFNGSIDDLRVYNRVLTVSEIKKFRFRTD